MRNFQDTFETLKRSLISAFFNLSGYMMFSSQISHYCKIMLPIFQNFIISLAVKKHIKNNCFENYYQKISYIRRKTRLFLLNVSFNNNIERGFF